MIKIMHGILAVLILLATLGVFTGILIAIWIGVELGIKISVSFVIIGVMLLMLNEIVAAIGSKISKK